MVFQRSKTNNIYTKTLTGSGLQPNTDGYIIIDDGI